MNLLKIIEEVHAFTLLRAYIELTYIRSLKHETFEISILAHFYMCMRFIPYINLKYCSNIS